jgi:hypothetical protein
MSETKFPSTYIMFSFYIAESSSGFAFEELCSKDQNEV